METALTGITRLYWLMREKVMNYLASVIISILEPHYGNLSPGEWTLKLLGDPNSHAGKKILEVGCGRAQNCIAFAKRGAICTGVDISPEMISQAEELVMAEGVVVDLRVMDACDLSSLPINYDVVFSSYCLGFVGDIEVAFRQINLRLKMRGQFVFCFTHPAQYVPPPDELAITERAAPDKWEENRYTINQTTGVLTKAGFLVERVVEQITENPSQLSPEERSRFPYQPTVKLLPEYDKYTHLPHTIIYACRKVDKVSALTPALVGKN